jgi:hypothetical protein
VGRRQRRRQQRAATTPTFDYADAEGNVLTLRARLTAGTVSRLRELDVPAAASAEDRWQRRGELLFERLAVSWTIAGLPLTGQAELLGRYRMADADTRRWVRTTIDEHLRRHQPEIEL